jgi:hypothetical protein
MTDVMQVERVRQHQHQHSVQDLSLLLEVAGQDALNNHMAFSRTSGYVNATLAEFVHAHFDCDTRAFYDARRIKALLRNPSEQGLLTLARHMRITESTRDHDPRDYMLRHPFGIPPMPGATTANVILRTSCLSVLTVLEDCTRYASPALVHRVTALFNDKEIFGDYRATVLRYGARVKDAEQFIRIALVQTYADALQTLCQKTLEPLVVRDASPEDTRRWRVMGERLAVCRTALWHMLNASIGDVTGDVTNEELDIDRCTVTPIVVDPRLPDTSRELRQLLIDCGVTPYPHLDAWYTVIHNAVTDRATLARAVLTLFRPQLSQFCGGITANITDATESPSAQYIAELAQCGLFDAFERIKSSEGGVVAVTLDGGHTIHVRLSTVSYVASGTRVPTPLKFLACILALYQSLECRRDTVFVPQPVVRWHVRVTHPFFALLHRRSESDDETEAAADEAQTLGSVWTTLSDEQAIFLNNLTVILAYCGLREPHPTREEDMAKRKRSADELIGLARQIGDALPPMQQEAEEMVVDQQQQPTKVEFAYTEPVFPVTRIGDRVSSLPQHRKRKQPTVSRTRERPATTVAIPTATAAAAEEEEEGEMEVFVEEGEEPREQNRSDVVEKEAREYREYQQRRRSEWQARQQRPIESTMYNDTYSGLCQVRRDVAVYRFVWTDSDSSQRGQQYVQSFGATRQVRSEGYERFSTSLRHALDFMGEATVAEGSGLTGGVTRAPRRTISATDIAFVQSLALVNVDSTVLLDIDGVLALYAHRGTKHLRRKLRQRLGLKEPRLENHDDVCICVLYWLCKRMVYAPDPERLPLAITTTATETFEQTKQAFIAFTQAFILFARDRDSLALFLSTQEVRLTFGEQVVFIRLDGWSFQARCELLIMRLNSRGGELFDNTLSQLYLLSALVQTATGDVKSGITYDTVADLRALETPVSQLYTPMISDTLRGQFMFEWDASAACDETTELVLPVLPAKEKQKKQKTTTRPLTEESGETRNAASPPKSGGSSSPPPPLQPEKTPNNNGSRRHEKVGKPLPVVATENDPFVSILPSNRQRPPQQPVRIQTAPAKGATIIGGGSGGGSRSTITSKTTTTSGARPNKARRMVGDTLGQASKRRTGNAEYDRVLEVIAVNFAKTSRVISDEELKEAGKVTPDAATQLKILAVLGGVGSSGQAYQTLDTVWRDYSFIVMWKVIARHVDDQRLLVGPQWLNDIPEVIKDDEYQSVHYLLVERYDFSLNNTLALYARNKPGFVHFLALLLEDGRLADQKTRLASLGLVGLDRLYSERISVNETQFADADEAAYKFYVQSLTVDDLFEMSAAIDEQQRLKTASELSSSGGSGNSSDTDGDIVTIVEREEGELEPNDSMDAVERGIDVERTIGTVILRQSPSPKDVPRSPVPAFDMHCHRAKLTVDHLRRVYASGYYLGAGTYGMAILYRFAARDQRRSFDRRDGGVEECVIKYQAEREYGGGGGGSMADNEKKAMLIIQNCHTPRLQWERDYHHHVRLLDYGQLTMDLTTEGFAARLAPLPEREHKLQQFMHSETGKALFKGRKNFSLLVQQYVNHGTLFKFLHDTIDYQDKRGRDIDMGLFLNVVVQLTGYLAVLYWRSGITHNDLKFDNVFVDSVPLPYRGDERGVKYFFYDCGRDYAVDRRQLVIANIGALCRVGDFGTAQFGVKSPWFDIESILLFYVQIVVAKRVTVVKVSGASRPIEVTSLRSNGGTTQLYNNPTFLRFIVANLRDRHQIELDYEAAAATRKDPELFETSRQAQLLLRHLLEKLLDAGTRHQSDYRSYIWGLDETRLDFIRKNTTHNSETGRRNAIFLIAEAEMKWLGMDAMGLDLILHDLITYVYQTNSEWRSGAVHPEHANAYDRLFARIAAQWPGMVRERRDDDDANNAGRYAVMNNYRAYDRDSERDLRLRDSACDDNSVV